MVAKGVDHYELTCLWLRDPKYDRKEMLPEER